MQPAGLSLAMSGLESMSHLLGIDLIGIALQESLGELDELRGGVRECKRSN